MAQSIMLKRREKALAVIATMQDKLDVDEFIRIFMVQYPDDWMRINQRWQKHQNTQEKHPMPAPKQYLENLYNTYYR